MNTQFYIFMYTAFFLSMGSLTAFADTLTETQVLTSQYTLHSGQSVAIDGDTALTGSDGISGLVSVFERDNSGFWNEDAPPISGESTDAGFGHAIALDADTALVGAWKGDGHAPDSGVAYIFTQDSSGLWSEQQQLSASDGATGDSFGYAVAWMETERSLAPGVMTGKPVRMSGPSMYFYATSTANGVNRLD